ncbi:MAG: hypothetical protein R3D85_16565 [Paracoccaceae bacterium]
MRSARVSEQVQPFGRQFGGDRLGHLVVGQDQVDIVIDPGGPRPDLDHHVEADPLGGAALLLEGADLDLDDMVAQRNPVERMVAAGGLRARVGMGKGQGDFVAHGYLPPCVEGRA